MKLTKGVLTDETWIDYIEGEIEPNLHQDLAILLRNSLPDRASCKSLARTRQLVEKSDDPLISEDGLYYDRMHEKIMAAVESAEEAVTEPELPREARFAWRAVVNNVLSWRR